MAITLNGTTGITTPQLTASTAVTTPEIDAGNIVGQVLFFAMTTAPTGFLKCNGAAISRTAYAALFSAIGTTYGAGDGSTTFNLPDLRGEFLRGWDDGRGADSGRTFGSAQSDAIRNITGSFDLSQLNNASHLDNPLGAHEFGSALAARAATNSGTSPNNRVRVGFDASNVVPTADENRPRNIALLACIKF